MVYVTVPVCAAVKVPEITPVVNPMLNPAGKAGEMAYLGEPPEMVGTIAVIAVPCRTVCVAGE